MPCSACRCNPKFDALYAKEVAPRMPPNSHFIDHGAGSIYINSQVRAAAAELSANLFSNPGNMINKASSFTTVKIEALRQDLLQFFGASPKEYDLVFTRSATGALNLLAESFPWGPGSQLAYLDTAHHAVVAMRGYATGAGGAFKVVTETDVEKWIKGGPGPAATGKYNLFAYPGKDNFGGVLYPQAAWIKKIQAKSTAERKWQVLIDVASLVPTHRLNLTASGADYAVASFYKIFGLPTGVGALIMKKTSATALKRIYFGSGSSVEDTASLDFVVRSLPPSKFQDGTLPFLEILSLRHGLNAIKAVGGMDAVHAHVTCVQNRIYNGLKGLRHTNGAKMLRLAGKHGDPRGEEVQGGVFTMQLLKPDGTPFNFKVAAAEFAAAGIFVREGCQGNPGHCAKFANLTDAEIKAAAEDQLLDSKGLYNGQSLVSVPVKRGGKTVNVPLGAIRASLGWLSRAADADALVNFIKAAYKDRTDDSAAILDREKLFKN
jgi:molybdenum cofactor sulfurtransferase